MIRIYAAKSLDEGGDYSHYATLPQLVYNGLRLEHGDTYRDIHWNMTIQWNGQTIVSRKYFTNKKMGYQDTQEWFVDEIQVQEHPEAYIQ